LFSKFANFWMVLRRAARRCVRPPRLTSNQ
jgi:hypothetical protein